jgi:hypothetical protein
MRCRRAQQWMTATDGLAPRRRRALDRHLVVCPSCRAEQAAGVRLDVVLAALPREAPVSAALEQATLRAVRLAAAAEEERPARSLTWWLGVSVPALAAAAVVVVAVGVRRTAAPDRPSARGGAPLAAASPATKAPQAVASAPAARAEPAPPAVASRDRAFRAALDEPPPELAAAPERFIDLPVLRNLDKLRHYEAITGIDDDVSDPGQAPQSDG